MVCYLHVFSSLNRFSCPVVPYPDSVAQKTTLGDAGKTRHTCRKAGVRWGVLTLVEGTSYLETQDIYYPVQGGGVSSSQCEVAGGDQSQAGNILEEAEVMLSAQAIMRRPPKALSFPWVYGPGDLDITALTPKISTQSGRYPLLHSLSLLSTHKYTNHGRMAR